MKIKYHFASLDEVKDVAKAIVGDWNNYKVMAFYGEMGVGKTTLIKEICAQFGVLDVVNSPSFSIVNEYLTLSNDTIYHFDFYRIENIQEALDMGCEDYFYSANLCLIEWPENIESLLPENTLKITINLMDGEMREIEIGKR